MKSKWNLLKDKTFMLYLTAQIFSVFSDSCFAIFSTWQLASSQNAFSALAITLVVSYLPNLLVGMWGGYVIDCLDRKKIMVFCDASSFCVLIVFCVLNNRQHNSLSIIVVRFLLSLMDVFYAPAANAYMTSIITAENYVGASAITNLVCSASSIISSGVAGTLILLIGKNSLLMINACTYLLAAFCIARIPNKSGKVVGSKKAIQYHPKEFIRGFSEIIHNSLLYQFVWSVLLTNIIYGIVYTTIPIYVQAKLGEYEFEYGILQSSISMGMMVGTAIIGVIKITKPGKLFLWATLAQSVSLIVLGINCNFYIAIFLTFLFSVCDAFALPLFASWRLHVCDEIKGRVFSAFDTIVLFATPISSLVLTCVGSERNIGILYIVSGVFLVLCCIVFTHFKTLIDIKS